MRALQPPGWERPKGYSNGIEAEGRMVFVAGQIGWDNGVFKAADFAGQFRQVLVNTLAVLKEAGAGPEHIARMTWFVTSRDEYEASLRDIGFDAYLTEGIGALIGAYVLTSLPGQAVKPWIAGYLLLLGVYIVVKAFHAFAPQEVTTYLSPLAFFGAFFDAIGGGGWGAIVTSNLLARGHDLRETIGSVNAVEFFVTLASSAVFLATLGLGHWKIVVALALGGLLAAPLGGWLVGRVPRRPMMVAVGLLIVGLSARTLWLALG